MICVNSDLFNALNVKMTLSYCLYFINAFKSLKSIQKTERTHTLYLDMEIKYAIICETGVRSNNEDSYGIIELPKINRWTGIICDGLGGHAMGEIASETVVSAISEYWNMHTNISDSADTTVSLAISPIA